MQLQSLEDEKQEHQDQFLNHGDFLIDITQELQSDLKANDKMLATFQKNEHSKKESRNKGPFPKQKEEKAKKRLASKIGNKKFCTTCKMGGHWNDKCWRLHLELQSK